MEKAFDLKELVARLKARGIPLAEDLAEDLYREVSQWIKDSAVLHTNALVQSLVPVVMAAVDPLALKQLDKIDGVEGQ
jgi:hypothetical protein